MPNKGFAHLQFQQFAQQRVNRSVREAGNEHRLPPPIKLLYQMRHHSCLATT